MNERLKELREALHIKQGDFARRISTTQGHISDIENGRKELSDRTIKLISLEFNVNENWLRTGQGEIFREILEEDKVAAYVSELLEDNGDNPLYILIKEIMHTYNELDPKSKDVIKSSVSRLIENLCKKKEG